VLAAIRGVEVDVRGQRTVAVDSQLAAITSQLEPLSSDALPVCRVVAVCLRLRVSPRELGLLVLGTTALRRLDDTAAATRSAEPQDRHVSLKPETGAHRRGTLRSSGDKGRSAKQPG
jgi:hypothetical protein